MKLFISALLFILAANTGWGQSLKKYTIGNSGCSAYFYCNPGTFAVEKSPDSSEVYTGECTEADMTYGLICVKLKDKIKELDASEEVLISYLDYLKKALNITSAAGYGKGHRLKNNPNTRGVIDYWKTTDENWKIKGWTDGSYIGFMYVCTKKNINEFKGDVFLNALVLPGMKGEY